MTTAATTAVSALLPEQVAELPWHPVEDWDGIEQKVLSAHLGVVVGLLRLRPGAHESDHAHGRVQHDAWVLAGEVQVGQQRLGPGSFVHVPSGVVHTLRDTGSGCLLLYVLNEQ